MNSESNEEPAAPTSDGVPAPSSGPGETETAQPDTTAAQQPPATGDTASGDTPAWDLL